MTPDDLLSRCTFPAPGAPVRCAVSGGADSSALMVLAVAAGCDVTAVHVDHGLRPDSHRDAELVRSTAGRLGAAFEAHRVEVGAGPNLEARARAARRRVLGDAATGHTADDQAETVLGNLLRGAGLDGIAAMRPGHHHPILGLRRHETRSLCEATGIEVVDDPTNRDPRFRRNRLRHEVLPLLGDVAERDVVPLLCRTAAHARAAVDLLEADAGALDPTDVAVLAAAPPELARRAVRAWLRVVAGGSDQHPPDAAAVARVLAVVHGSSTATEVAGGVRVARRAGRLRVEVTEPDEPATALRASD